MPRTGQWAFTMTAAVLTHARHTDELPTSHTISNQSKEGSVAETDANVWETSSQGLCKSAIVLDGKPFVQQTTG